VYGNTKEEQKLWRCNKQL